MEKINFYFEEVPRFQLKQPFVRQVFRKIALLEGYSTGEITVICCSDAYLLAMNKAFLKHHYLTDIITFDNSDEGIISGELYISVDRVKENAAKYSVRYKQELMRVMIHGVLHLLGYHDKSREERKEMRAKENHYLSLFDIEKEY